MNFRPHAYFLHDSAEFYKFGTGVHKNLLSSFLSDLDCASSMKQRSYGIFSWNQVQISAVTLTTLMHVFHGVPKVLPGRYWTSILKYATTVKV
jgi:hypothetical protein